MSFKAIVLLLSLTASVSALITPHTPRSSHHRALAARVIHDSPVAVLAPRQRADGKRCRQRPASSVVVPFATKVSTTRQLLATTFPRPDPTTTPRQDPTTTPRQEPVTTSKPEPTTTPEPAPTTTPRQEPVTTPRQEPVTTPRQEPVTTPKPEPTTTPKPPPTTTPKPDPTTTPKQEPTTTPKQEPTIIPKPQPTTTPKPQPTTTPKQEPTTTPNTTPKPAPTPKPTTTKAAEPAPTTIKAPPVGGNLPSFMTGTQTGQGTFYDAGLGACGITNSDSDYIAAVSHKLFDNFPGYNRVNPNNNPMCGRKVRVTFQGKSVVVALTDRCESCDVADLDFSRAAFGQIAAFSLGRISNIKWVWL